MKACLLIARSNLRRTKGQTVAIVLLLLLAALMLNLWLMLATDYKQNFDRCHDRLHAEHVMLVLSEDCSDLQNDLTQIVKGDARICESNLASALEMVAVFPYQGGEVNSEFILLEKEQALNRSVGKIEIVEEGNFSSGIYMPLLYRSEQIAVGKTIDIMVGSHSVSFTVCGFFNSVMAGSHNCSMTLLIFTDDQYQKLEQSGYASHATLCSVRLADKSESMQVETTLKHAVSERYPELRIGSNSYALVSKSRYISQMIASGVLSAMAFLVLLITVVVTVSNIANDIQETMKNLGAFKAIGYTSRRLIASFLLQFFGVTILASIIGIGLSYILFPAINDMMILQTGIPYTVHFLVFPFCATIGLLLGTIGLCVWLSARKIQKIEPIVALRQGIQTHNFHRNPVPLAKTKAPLSVALAWKTTLSHLKQNLVIAITMLVLSLVIVFSGLMIKNVILDMTPFLNLIVGETADSCINVDVKAEEQFLHAMQEDDRVDAVYLYTTLTLSHAGGVELMVNICDDFSKVSNQDVIIQGRFPKYENEIAIAVKYARESGLHIGEEITVAVAGKEERYIVSGFTQISNNLGRDGLLTRAGYERLVPLQQVSYYLRLQEGTDIDAFHQQVQKQLGTAVYATLDIHAIIEGTASVYVSLMTIIVLGVVLLSLTIVVLVLYLLVRTIRNRQIQRYGILKSIGFTTGQLILQTSLSFMPAILVSTAAGIAISILIINPLTALFLNSIGIVTCTFTVPIPGCIGAGALLIGLTFSCICLFSLKLRSITPRRLLSED